MSRVAEYYLSHEYEFDGEGGESPSPTPIVNWIDKRMAQLREALDAGRHRVNELRDLLLTLESVEATNSVALVTEHTANPKDPVAFLYAGSINLNWLIGTIEMRIEHEEKSIAEAVAKEAALKTTALKATDESAAKKAKAMAAADAARSEEHTS